MKKNLLALSIAAMVGGLSGVANAQAVVTDTVGGRLVSNLQTFGTLVPPGSGPQTLTVVGANGQPVVAPASVTQAPAANQLVVTPAGIGHILVVPYFTTQGSHATLLNLVNTDTANGKAVKLRFRGAANSDDLFDITVFLSPGDVWTANVSANGELSALTTADTSCTLPSAAQIKETFGKFSTNRVLDNAAAQTREGYVEILNMADIPPRSIVNAATGELTNSALYTATKHVNGVAPCTQGVMDAQAQPLSANPLSGNNPQARGYSWPTGGLMANWTVVDVGTKASFSGEAIAVRAVNAAGVSGAANLVFSPQTGDPVGTTAFNLTADPLLKLGTVRAASYDFPDLSTPYTTGGTGTPEDQANALAGALATQFISNEYLTNPAVNFATDWVFSMPTRRYAVAMNYETKTIVGHGTQIAPNVNYVGGFIPAVDASNYFSAANGGNVSLNREKTRICVDSRNLLAFDHEEQSRTSFVISPSDILKFCGETSVLTFNGKASVLGASLAVNNIDTKFTDGWLRIATPGLGAGLPVVGYAVGKAIGPDGGNFGGTWMHRTSR